MSSDRARHAPPDGGEANALLGVYVTPPTTNRRSGSAGTRERSFAAVMQRDGDNFLLLRLLAAIAVIYGHSYAIAGDARGDLIARLGLGNDIYAGSIAVDVFFVISGFLVTGAWLRRPQLLAFLRARALRIVPAYALCLVLTAFVLGASCTVLPLAKYWRDSRVLGYVLTNLTFPTHLAWTLPGVFSGNPLPDTVNGSLWTLPAEVRAYFALAVLGLLGCLQHRARLLLAFLAIAAACVVIAHVWPQRWQLDYVHLAGMFLLGIGTYAFREKLPHSGWLLLALAAIASLSRGSSVISYTFSITLAYASLWFAYAPLGLQAFNRLGDYSYGTYLWGYPIQQTVALALAGADALTVFAVSTPLALACGVVSWHLVEKPALRFKHTRPSDTDVA